MIDVNFNSIGFALQGDVEKLATKMPNLHAIQSVDLKPIFKNLLDLNFKFPHDPIPGKEGLTSMTKAFLGKPLNKHQTMSNWLNCPLRENQRLYAAYDSLCPLKIFEAMKSLMSDAEFGTVVIANQSAAAEIIPPVYVQHAFKQQADAKPGEQRSFYPAEYLDELYADDAEAEDGHLLENEMLVLNQLQGGKKLSKGQRSRRNKSVRKLAAACANHVEW